MNDNTLVNGGAVETVKGAALTVLEKAKSFYEGSGMGAWVRENMTGALDVASNLFVEHPVVAFFIGLALFSVLRKVAVIVLYVLLFLCAQQLLNG